MIKEENSKSVHELLYEKLILNNKNGFSKISEEEENSEQNETKKMKIDSINNFCKDYKIFLKKSKTERETVDEVVKLLTDEGFRALENLDTLNSGDKIYSVNRGKGVLSAVIGSEPLEKGISIIGAHVDVPRLDLKPNPLFEEHGNAYLKTHYYGGIKKYQWLAIPLAIHGTIVKQDGAKIKICIGENEEEPVFCITDLLPHLAHDQMQKKMNEAINGEILNVLVGNIPHEEKKVKDRVKFNTLKLINEKYNIVEEDFLSCEIEIVPAFNPRDLGFDRSMIAAYGHDDRVCTYAACRAIIDAKEPPKTAVCILVDKEEVGSLGNTGMQSRFFEDKIAKIISLKEKSYSDLMLRDTFSKSICLSADVGVAYDPNFPEVFEERNTSIINGGVMLSKYTGSRGKSGASDASAELVARIRNIFNKNGVIWQMGGFGKVDIGGGGTIAAYVANLNIDTIDCGVPLFSMHAPYEIAGKFDIFMAYKGYKAFYEDKD
ncbi:MAG: aminopeptidase [Clostridiales bacterium]|jgi:aspartyl aminopeptidase|nr:aminopeptidase [Clostridiales bacterium]